MAAVSHAPSSRPASAPSPTVRTIRVWDPVVRLFHWLMAAGFVANMFVLEEGKRLHRWAGYAILAAIAVRLIWGFIGPVHARFSDFVPAPRRLLIYSKALLARREPRYVGHNPAAAVMMAALVGLMVLCGVTGWMQGLDAYWGVKWVRELHEATANAILMLAGLHVAAAIVESVRHRENLVWSMITGRKRAPSGDDVVHAPASGRG